jgi:hypothetical protein
VGRVEGEAEAEVERRRRRRHGLGPGGQPEAHEWRETVAGGEAVVYGLVSDCSSSICSRSTS